LRRHLFGRKAEQVDPRQTQMAFDQAVPDLATQFARAERDTTEVRGHTRKNTKPHGRAPIPEDLPIERIELPPPLDTTGMVRIGEEVKEVVEWRAASMVRVQIVRPKYAFPGQEERGVAIAELPDSPIPRGKAGVGLLAHVIVSKYADHLPLHRQSHMLERHGVIFSRSTLCGWLKPCAKLLCHITQAMHEEAMRAPWIGIDATGVLVRDAERYQRHHFWVMVAGGEHVLFRYSKRHNGATAHDLLKGHTGFVLADASKQSRIKMGSSQEPCNLGRNEGRLSAKIIKGGGERRVALDSGLVKRIVRGPHFCLLPTPINRIEFGRVRREACEFDALVVDRKPCFALGIEIVARAVVHDEEDFTAGMPHKVLEKGQERLRVEDRREQIVKRRPRFQRDCTEYVSRLPHAKGIDPGLDADARPRLMERAVEPETYFVLEHEDSSARGCFFLMAGNLLRNQWACASASARANRLRGRCTENPRLCSRRGMWWLWSRTPKRCAIRSPIIGPVQTPLEYPATRGPDSTSAVSSSRWACSILAGRPSTCRSEDPQHPLPHTTATSD
jgi:transposase